MERRRWPEWEDGARLYGFVESVAPALDGNGWSRMGLALDCALADAFDEAPETGRGPENLAMVRVLTTPARLKWLFRLERAPAEGDWLEITLGRTADHPPAWVLPAANDYGGPVMRTNLIDARFLRDEPERSGRSVRASQGEVAAFCTVPGAGLPDDDEFRTLMELNALERDAVHVRVVDVGQASCAAFHRDRDTRAVPLGYFDVGAPIFFNGASFPAPFHEAAPGDGFVMLSHWDFDHYALAVWRLKALQSLRWFAPDQPVGFNAAALQAHLGSRLIRLRSPTLGLGRATLMRGLGPPGDRNGSGYVFKLQDPAGDLLLTADVDYHLIPPAALAGVVRLTVPHHGAGGAGPAPPGPGRAVASYGLPNKYRHPNEPYLSAHAAAGWSVERTAAHGGQARQSRWL